MQNKNKRNWSISSELVCTEAEKRGYTIEVVDISKNLFYIVGNGKKYFCKNVDVGLNSSLAFRCSKEKDHTYLLLEKANIRIPKTSYIMRKDIDKLSEIARKYQFPVVTKPIDGTHGDGVAVDLRNEADFVKGALYSFGKDTEKIVVQSMIRGSDFRVVTVGGKVIAVAHRVPPYVVGNGKNTLQELIDEENTNPLRGIGNHETPLSQIKLDDEALQVIKEQGITLNDIPKNGIQINIRKNGNLSTGGYSIDVTNSVHPDIIETCEKAAATLGIAIAGIDIMTTDITKSLEETNGAIIEINHTPGLRMHHFPSSGKSRDVAGAILDLLFNSK